MFYLKISYDVQKFVLIHLCMKNIKNSKGMASHAMHTTFLICKTVKICSLQFIILHMDDGNSIGNFIENAGKTYSYLLNFKKKY